MYFNEGKLSTQLQSSACSGSELAVALGLEAGTHNTARSGAGTPFSSYYI
jgi:hypothetical protein